MNIATLHRTPLDGCNSGILHIGDEIFFTVERPWIPHPHSAGGTPFKSCIPDGTYRLERFLRSNGDIVPVMVNESLGVYARSEDRALCSERYACLVHVANKVEEVVGCIGPGLGARFENGEYRTISSRKAMDRLQSLLVNQVTHLEIVTNGSRNTPTE